MDIKSEKVKFLVPYIGSLLVLSGYLKLDLYYSKFNIQIGNYLEITEVLTLFLADAIKYVSMLFFVFLFLFIIETEEEIEEKEIKKSEMLETGNWFSRLKKFIRFTSILVFLLSMLLIATLCAYVWKPTNLYYLIMIDTMYIFLFLFTYVLFEFKRKYLIRYGKRFHPTYNNIVLIIALFLMNVFLSAYMETTITKKSNQYFVCFKYLKTNIHSDKTFIFLGQSKNYLFMYDLDNQDAQIFDRKDITNLIIHKN